MLIIRMWTEGAPVSRSRAVGGWCGPGSQERGPFQGERQHLSVRRAQRVSAGRPAEAPRGDMAAMG